MEINLDKNYEGKYGPSDGSVLRPFSSRDQAYMKLGISPDLRGQCVFVDCTDPSVVSLKERAFDQQKAVIDKMDYETMLRHHRFDESGSLYFSGDELGKYFSEKFKEAQLALSSAVKVAASKRVGWDSK